MDLQSWHATWMARTEPHSLCQSAVGRRLPPFSHCVGLDTRNNVAACLHPSLTGSCEWIAASNCAVYFRKRPLLLKNFIMSLIRVPDSKRQKKSRRVTPGILWRRDACSVGLLDLTTLPAWFHVTTWKRVCYKRGRKLVPCDSYWLRISDFSSIKHIETEKEKRKKESRRLRPSSLPCARSPTYATLDYNSHKRIPELCYDFY